MILAVMINAFVVRYPPQPCQLFPFIERTQLFAFQSREKYFEQNIFSIFARWNVTPYERQNTGSMALIERGDERTVSLR